MHPVLPLAGILLAGLAGAVIWAVTRMLPKPYRAPLPRCPNTPSELLALIDRGNR